MTTRTQAMSAELALLEARLRELVAMLDGAEVGAGTLERAWRACEQHAPALASAGRDLAQEERAALRVQLERLAELNAIAREGAERALEATGAELLFVRRARLELERVESPTEVGESCDVTR